MKTLNDYKAIIILLALTLGLLGCDSIGNSLVSEPNSNETTVSPPEDTELTKLVEYDVTYQDSLGWDPEFSKMDIYYTNQESEKGVIVFVHGGGWVSEDKQSYKDKGRY